MESQTNHHLFEKRSLFKSKAPAVKWFKEWVPQDVVATGGKCHLLKWVAEDLMKVMNEKSKEPEAPELEPEPTTEVLFLCSYEGCGKTFIDVGALKKHSHIHGERQYVCHYEGCGKKFLDSSKLKRHFLIHTGERDFVCPHEGCGKAFSLDFNLRSHMKTHSQENYHLCPYMDCGKRYAHEYKLKNHISIHHEKNMLEMTKYVPSPPPPLPLPEKPLKSTKPSAAATTGDRPYSCPLEGCDKTYIHVYKLNLHLRKGHKINLSDNNALIEGKKKLQTTSRPSKPSLKMPTPKMARRKGSSPSTITNTTSVNEAMGWPIKEVFEEEDSEETEEDEDNVKDRWRRSVENNNCDDWRSAENNNGVGDDDDDGVTAAAVNSDDDEDDDGREDVDVEDNDDDDNDDEEDTEYED